MNAEQITALIKAHAWIPLAAIVIGLIVRLLKSDTKIPIDIPPRWRAPLAVLLGVVASILDKVATGTPWKDAVIGGATATALAMVTHNLVIGSMRDGKEFVVPGLIKPGVAPGPNKPPSLPPPANTSMDSP